MCSSIIDKVVTFLPYCWTVGSQNYALAVPATGTMNKFFIGIVTIDIDGRIEFIDETEPHFENGVFPPLRPKYDHVDGRVAATLAEKNGYIYVATRPVPRYEAGPVELWRFDLGDRQWTLIDTWELDILWGASMSTLFDETVLMLVGGMSMVATNVQCYLYLLSSRVGYGVVTNVTGKRKCSHFAFRFASFALSYILLQLHPFLRTKHIPFNQHQIKTLSPNGFSFWVPRQDINITTAIFIII
jgi:hypothetical protein